MARAESTATVGALQPTPSETGGFSRRYLRGLACAVYVGVANGSFLVSAELSCLRRAQTQSVCHIRLEAHS